MKFEHPLVIGFVIIYSTIYKKCYSDCLHYGLYNVMQVAIRISQGSSLEWRQISSLAIVYSTFLFRRRSKKTSKLCATSLCVGNSPVTGEFPAQMASNAENISIWSRHHVNTGLNRLLCTVYPITYARNFVVDFCYGWFCCRCISDLLVDSYYKWIRFIYQVYFITVYTVCCQWMSEGWYMNIYMLFTSRMIYLDFLS